MASCELSLMTRQAIDGNLYCPCGSGKKNKKCCLPRGIRWVRDADGTLGREVQFDEGLKQELMDAFAQKHGREARPEDKLFDEEEVTAATRELVERMRALGVDPAYIYAFEKTGLLLSEENIHQCPPGFLDEFRAAQDEWHQLHGKRPKEPKQLELARKVARGLQVEAGSDYVPTMMIADILDVLAKLNLRLVEGGAENPARKAYQEYLKTPEMVEFMKDVRESMGHHPERN